MNPQGWFQSVTWLPKPVNTQALTGFPTPTTIQVPNSLLPSLHNPREWTPTLLCHTVPQAVLLLPGLQCSWSRISMLGLSGLTVVRKDGHRPSISDMQASNHGWTTPTISTTNNTMDSLQQFIFLSQAKTRTRKDEWVT
jgi:hypothetical protein